MTAGLAGLAVQAVEVRVLLEQQALVLAARQHQVRVALVGVQLQPYQAVQAAAVQARGEAAQALETVQTQEMALPHLFLGHQ